MNDTKKQVNDNDQLIQIQIQIQIQIFISPTDTFIMGIV